MAKKYDFDDSDGVWRTVGGRRIFIKNGQDLASAMVESGKFKNLRSTYKKGKEEKEKEEKKKEIDPDLLNKQKETDVWEKQPDGTFLANKDAMKKQYEENHKNYDAKIKQFAEDRKNMTNGDWEGMLMAYEKQNADGTYKTLQDIMDDVDKYEKANDRKFKASMGEVDIPDNFEAQFNDYAKEQEEKERLEIAKDIAKEVYGLNDKNASPERIEKEAKKILEPQDGEVLEKGDTPYTNAKGELERSTKSLKEWRDELKKTSENKDGFTQQTDMYGGTYEYTQQRLNEMKEHGTKPLEHSYTGGGWQGLKYDSTLSTKDIAKNINDYSKKEFPDVKLSRKTDYNGIDMYVMSSDKDMFVSEKDIDNMNFSDLEQVTRSNGFNWWAKENVKDYEANHSYSIDDVRKYAKEQLNNTKSHDSNPSSDSWYLSDYGKKVISGLNKEMNSYNYDDSDGMVDYFDTNFYGYVHIGKWDKPYQVSQKSTNETKKNTIADAIARNNELNKKLASEGRTYDDHLIEKRTNGKYKTMDELLDTAERMSTNETMNKAIREKASKTNYSKLDNYEVYDKADALARETKNYTLKSEINKTLDRIDMANKKGSGYAEKPTNDLREILSEVENGNENQITNTLREKAYKKYLKEHPGSKISFEDYKNMYK